MPKISPETLTEKEREVYHNLDRHPYGQTLAVQVAEKLLSGKGLYHAHRDYCGSGLFYYKNQFTLGTVYDGYDAPNMTVVTFEKIAGFVQWLANENDQSMALYGNQFNNQSITKIRLKWFLEDHYSPVWNDYCAYVRNINDL